MTEYKKTNTVQYKTILLAGISFILLSLFCVPAHAGNLSKEELEYWNSPEFKKRIADSYLAESDIEPKVEKEQVREKILKVFELRGEDKTDEAIKILNKEITDNSNANFDFLLATIYYEDGDLDKASVYYEKALEKFPRFRRVLKNLGIVYIRKGEMEKAIPVLTKALELGSTDVLTYAFLGYAYLSANNNLCAESAYRMAVLLEPETMDWKVGLATSLLKQQRYAESASLLDNLIVTDPNKTELWLYQANAYLGMNQPLKAAVNFEFVDQMGKSTIATLTKLGDIYVNQKLYDTAVDSYSRSLKKETSDISEQTDRIDHLIHISDYLIRNGAFAESKKLIDNIHTSQESNLSDDNNNELLKLRAKIAMSEGADEEQVQILEEILKFNPLDGQALILLGKYYERKQETEQAIIYYERAEELEEFEADAKLCHAQLLVRQHKLNEALPLLRRVNQLKESEEIQKFLNDVELRSKSK